jgi:hypothetical protein
MTHLPPPGHICQCPRCTPGAFPCEAQASQPKREGHVAVRFGDKNLYEVYINGVRSLHTFECMAGKGSWAINASRPVHGCRMCGGDVCQEVVRGDIRLVILPRSHTP